MVTVNQCLPQSYSGYIFDLDGTVYLGERVLPGAKETIAYLREHGFKTLFLSNKPLETREDYAAKLTRMGIPTEPESVINSSFVMAQYLLANSPGCRVYVVGETSLKRELMEVGIQVIEEYDPDKMVDYVIASFDRTLVYAKLNAALQYLLKGARFIATNADVCCPVDGGVIPDAGGIIAHLEACSGRKVEVVVGKPSEITVKAALSALKLDPEECLIVGDRLQTDVRMGLSAGIDVALVLSGVTTIDDLKKVSFRPTYVIEDIRGIVPCQSKINGG